MEAKYIFRRHRKKLAFGLLLLAGFLSGVGTCFAAAAAEERGVHQIETTVVHVDQYAVYAPNLVFYFDAQADKRKVASMVRTADQLRNKKALITYSSMGELGRDKHVLLMDITPAGGEKAGPEKAPADTSNSTVDLQAKAAKNSTTNEPPPKKESGEPDSVPGNTLQQEKKQAGSSSPVTKDELTVFVRRVLELNEKKDLRAIAPLYSDKVDYYDRGEVDRNYVIKDLEHYYRNWQEITTSLDGDVVMIVLDPEVRIAKFTTSYSVKNAKKSLEGKTENIWKVQRINGKLKLIDVKQKAAAR